LATLVSLCEPEKIIVGGGMADVGDLLLKPMQQAMARRCYLIDRGYIAVEFVRAQLGDQAGVIGAARLAFSHEV
jgi:glucokinase